MKHGRFQATSFVPIYYWRGARPHLVDLEAHQTGWLVCLCLTREGDTCLLPLAWEENSVCDNDRPPPTGPVVTLNTAALDGTAVSLTLNDLQQAGWAVNGRLTIQFTGRETEAHFAENSNGFLWQSPTEKK